jgi:hypothetical protein
MASRGGGAAGPDERRHFHGTDAATAAKIAAQGFSRSFLSVHACGMGAMGTYFARDACYSVPYSAPDAAADDRHMLLARVRVGDVHVAPPLGPWTRSPSGRGPGGGPLDQCDSDATADSVSS